MTTTIFLLRLTLEYGLGHLEYVRLPVSPLLPPLNRGLPPRRVLVRHEALDVVSDDAGHEGHGEHNDGRVGPRRGYDPRPHAMAENESLL